MILIKPGLDYEIHNIQYSKQGCYIIMDVRIKGQAFTLCNVYAPNNDDPDFFRTLFSAIDNMDNANHIIGGNYNLVFEPCY